MKQNPSEKYDQHGHCAVDLHVAFFETRHNAVKGMSEALDEVELFSGSMGFDKHSTLRVRLLAEETLSMVRSIIDDFKADFWMESTDKCNCELHLLAVADMGIARYGSSSCGMCVL